MNRYSRHISLKEIGPEGQSKIAKAKILVIGAGGLGCPTLQYLAAAGVGTLGIIDFDVVEESNLQRQVLFGTSSLGKNKALAAKARLLDLNPTISINAYPEKLEFKNALGLFEKYDIIVDGSDNFETRYLANDTSILTQKPLVYGAIYKFEGQVSIFNFQNGPSYRCLFPNPPENSIPNCKEIGVLGVLPGIIGSIQANEVLKIILGLGDVLSGKLWCFNALSTQVTTFSIKRDEEKIQQVLKNGISDSNLIKSCKVEAEEISLKDIFKFQNIQWIDVREKGETPLLDNPDILNIPLSTFENNINKLNKNTPLVFFCQQGIRSKEAASICRQNNIKNSFSLKEGAADLLQYLKIRKHENYKV